MNSYLNREVSIFQSKESHNPQKATLAEFLLKCAESKAEIEKIRNETNKDNSKMLKSKLPCCTISGLFNGGHKTEDLIKHSGLICIDIDHCDPNKVIEQLRQLNIVLYASRSASGKGVFAVIPLAYPEKHKEQFQALKKWFVSIGIDLDDKCKDIPRLRYLSYDDKAFFNPYVVEFKGILEDIERKKVFTGDLFKATQQHTNTTFIGFNTKSQEYKSALRRATVCVEEIEKKGISIADDYGDWVKMASALSTLGEDLKDEKEKILEERGRSLFHRISSFSPKYKFGENERLFNRVLRDNKSITIASFFDTCSRYGINAKKIEERKEIDEFLSIVQDQ